MKKITILFMTMLLAATLLSGCAAKTSNTSSKGWAYIQNKGELIIGLDDTFAPMGFRDDQNNLVGFDIDLAKAVTAKLGIKVKFQPIDWDAKELELSSKNIDCIWNGMSATPARQESMSLTKKYLNNRIIIMTKTGGKAVASKDDLKNMKIGTQAESAALETMQADPAYDSFKANITEYKSYDEVLLDMQAGRIDCMVVDEVLGEYKNTKLTNKLVVSGINFGDDYYAIGCRKDDADVATKLNEALSALIADGSAAKISTDWFGKNIVILEDYSK